MRWFRYCRFQRYLALSSMCTMDAAYEIQISMQGSWTLNLNSMLPVTCMLYVVRLGLGIEILSKLMSVSVCLSVCLVRGRGVWESKESIGDVVVWVWGLGTKF